MQKLSQTRIEDDEAKSKNRRDTRLVIKTTPCARMFKGHAADLAFPQTIQRFFEIRLGFFR